MRIRTAILNICLTLLIPFSANAKKPESGVCKISVPSMVNANSPFDVIVQPSEGQWRQPTVLVEVHLPLTDPVNSGTPDTYSQTVTMTFDGTVLPNNTPATFFIPSVGSLMNLDLMGDVHVFATVSEPVNRGKSVESYCEAVTGFMMQP